MKRIILSLCLFIFIRTEAQQINPVPDYVFSNKMSVGRNAVTDTAAYFSIGPRYGAIRGMMPPMVTDTASMSASKRNGLLIFSIQKNKYLYWDSVGSKWAEMAGTTGTALTSGDTASMLSPYIRAAGNGLTKSGRSLLVDTASIATRARVQKAVDSINTNVALKVNISDTASMLTPYPRGAGAGNYMAEWLNSRRLDTANMYYANGRFAIGSTTTTNGVFNVYGGRAYFDTSVLIGGTTLFANEAMNEVSIGTTTGFHALTVRTRTQASQPTRGIGLITSDLDSATSTGSRVQIGLNASTGNTTGRIEAFQQFSTAANLFLNPGGAEVIAGTGTDAGNYTFQIGGSLYNTGAGFLAASGFNDVRIGSTSGRQISGVAAGMLQVWDNPGNFGGITINGQNANNAFGAYVQFIKSRGTGNTALQQSDVMGGLFWGGADGTNIIRAASIEAIVDAAPGTNDMPSSLLLSTTSDGGTIPIERMRITSAGEVLIGTTTDAGAYALQVAGSIYNTTGAVLAASSGSIGIGTTSTAYKINVAGSIGVSGGGNGYVFGLTDANTRITGDNSGGVNTYIEMRTNGANRLRIQEDGEILLNNISDAGAYALQVAGAIYNTTTITTGAPTGGSIKPWRLGEAATVSPTSPNRTIRVEIDGTVYYIHAKTTND